MYQQDSFCIYTQFQGKHKNTQFVEQISSPHKSKTETKRTSKVNQPQ